MTDDQGYITFIHKPNKLVECGVILRCRNQNVLSTTVSWKARVNCFLRHEQCHSGRFLASKVYIDD
jgi:hypothetical protein